MYLCKTRQIAWLVYEYRNKRISACSPPCRNQWKFGKVNNQKVKQWLASRSSGFDFAPLRKIEPKWHHSIDMADLFNQQMSICSNSRWWKKRPKARLCSSSGICITPINIALQAGRFTWSAWSSAKRNTTLCGSMWKQYDAMWYRYRPKVSPGPICGLYEFR